MLREKILCTVKDELSDFMDCLSINPYQNFSNDFDHCAENIVDKILSNKGNLIYDLIVDGLRNHLNDGPINNGFYPSIDGRIECEWEHYSDAVADLFEDCTGEVYNTSYDEDEMMWDIYPDGY